jgi:hypothetical protein
LILQTGRRVRHLGNPNLYKSCVPCPCAYLRVLGLPITILHRIINYLGYPLGRFAGPKTSTDALAAPAANVLAEDFMEFMFPDAPLAGGPEA